MLNEEAKHSVISKNEFTFTKCVIKDDSRKNPIVRKEGGRKRKKEFVVDFMRTFRAVILNMKGKFV